MSSRAAFADGLPGGIIVCGIDEQAPGASNQLEDEARPAHSLLVSPPPAYVPPQDCLLLNEVLDILRGVLLKGEQQYSLEWIEALAVEGRSAYVGGFGNESWMTIKLGTNVNGRRLPRGASLLYSTPHETTYNDDADHCFVLNSLLDIVHGLVLTGDELDLRLALEVLRKISVEGVLSCVLGLSRTTWVQLKGHLKIPSGQVDGRTPVLLTGIMMRSDYEDDAEADVAANHGYCVMGLAPIAPRAIRMRRVPPMSLSS
eukprot:TRINITY_DN39721_c0_g1_i1.p1 TRINITY_DN39721_c0_g1~~TRINITY_DN39721_c0_g1_i1.p1  ORF type:complete len:258 (-),score=42.03 TRINITY_DN39721_c0_g1_i1:304-1077(-)